MVYYTSLSLFEVLGHVDILVEHIHADMCGIELLHNSMAYCSNLGNIGTLVTTRTCSECPILTRTLEVAMVVTRVYTMTTRTVMWAGWSVFPMAVTWCISSVWLYLCQYAIGGRGTIQCTLNCFAVSMIHGLAYWHLCQRRH